MIKIVLLGDSGVGKTLAIRTKNHKTYSESLVPKYLGNSYHTYVDPYSDEPHKYQIAIMDNYPSNMMNIYQAHCFVIFFSIDDKSSFENVKLKWLEFIKENVHYGRPVLLVATKVDLYHESKNIELVSRGEITNLLKELKCHFVEISSKNDLNSVNKMIEKSIILSIYHNEDTLSSGEKCNLQ